MSRGRARAAQTPTRAPQSPEERAIWHRYLDVMQRAERAALALADALERYLRHAEGAWYYFDTACDAATAYTEALDAAANWHHGVVRGFTTGHVINDDVDTLLAFVRELRGSAVPRTVLGPDGRKASVLVYADDGIAGFFRGEVRAMRRFGRPRRTPAGLVP